VIVQKEVLRLFANSREGRNEDREARRERRKELPRPRRLAQKKRGLAGSDGIERSLTAGGKGDLNIQDTKTIRGGTFEGRKFGMAPR